jgi:hypothetical protein
LALCDVCGRPLPRPKGAGRPPEHHPGECRLEARRRQAYMREMEQIARRFEAQGDPKEAAYRRDHAQKWLRRWARLHRKELRGERLEPADWDL